MSTRIATRILNENEYDRWEAFVQSSPQGTIYALPSYLDILCSATGDSFRVVGVFQGDELVGGVALYQQRSPAGVYVANRLLLYYNGPVLRAFPTRYPSKEISRQVAWLGALAETLNAMPYARLLLHAPGLVDARPFLVRGWSARPSYTYIMRLHDLAETWRRIEQNLRRLIKRCEAHGVTLTDDDDFESFFRLHLATHTRKAAPLYLPREAFARYVERLRHAGLGRLFHARLPDGRSAASQLVLLGPRPLSHTVCAGADAEHLHLGTTPFLRWQVCRAVAAMGYTGNDLTDAALNPVTRFKNQLGGDLVTNTVLQQADSFRFRWHLAVQRGMYRLKSSVGAALRRVSRGRKE